MAIDTAGKQNEQTADRMCWFGPVRLFAIACRPVNLALTDMG